MSSQRTVHKTCNLCEAMCGILIDVRDNQVAGIRPDPDDPLSHGAMCSKATALKEVQEDPDRLKEPVRRTANGWRKISWAEALGESAERLARIQLRHGDDAVASYLGNPGAHNLGIIMYLTLLYSVLKTRNRYSASSLDQNPKHASSLLLYGNTLSIPVPDLDHTSFMLLLGANPVVSNGSLMTAPGFLGRARALQKRGGQLVVVDPKRSETAAIADQYIPLRPGADALLLAATIHVVLDESLGRASHLTPFIDGVDGLRAALDPFSPETVQDELGLTASQVRDLARRFADADGAVCYGRVGTCMNPYGTLNSWLIDVLCLLTGNLDRRGGMLFPKPAADLAELVEQSGPSAGFDGPPTRVRGAPSFNGERPTACLAEEILEPGDGQIRGMVTVAGNPCLSAPGAVKLDRAFASLEFYVAVDFYINETTQHADIILPPMWSLEHDNHEILFHGFAIHNTAKYSPAVLEPDENQREDWQILSQLALGIAARKHNNPLARAALRLAPALVSKPLRVLDWAIRAGHYGDGFRPWKKGLRLADLERTPSGVDLGPLAPRLAAILERRQRRLDLAPARIMAELTRLREEGTRTVGHGDRDELLLIGRRDRRTNNSWLHNVPSSAVGRDRCTLQMHPADAQRRGLTDSQPVELESDSGRLQVRMELSKALMQGVVSLPHGWGHTGDGIHMQLASQRPGVNCNDLVGDRVLEAVVGNAVFNGVPVRVRAASRSSTG